MDIEQGPPRHNCDRGMTAPGRPCPACEYRPVTYADLDRRATYPRWVPVVAWLWVLGILSLIAALALAS